MRIFVSFASVALLVACPAIAQDNHGRPGNGAPPRVAMTSVPQEDANYPLMGEFVGPISLGDNQYAPLGLQVRPLPHDSFEAIQYQGGLPGQKTFKGEPLKLVGRRSDDLIVLSGGPWAIFVEQNSCLVVDRRGNRIGTLERVQRASPTLGAQAPEGSTILFDGSNTEQFTTAKITPDGLLMEGADVKPMFQDFNMHVEFRLPYMPNSDDQARGNSGCYLQSRYEIQVLDSFAQLPVFNGCSSIYRFKAPDLNMCLPPLQWQTYDIHFTAPRWAADGSKIRNGRITVWHNGVKTQDDVELKNKTGAGKEEAPTLLPIRFQNHGDPVRFRNIWIVDRGLVHTEFPIYPKTEPAKPKRPKQPKVLQAKPKEQAKPKDKPAEPKPEAKVDAAEKQPAAESKAEEQPAPKSAPAKSAEVKPAKAPDQPQADSTSKKPPRPKTKPAAEAGV